MPWSGAPGLAAAAAIPIGWPMLSTRQILAFGDFRFSLTTRELSLAKIDGPPIPVPLGSRATDLLYLFLQRPGDLVTKAEIMEAVWPNSVVEDSNLSVQISTLRRVLDESLPTSAIQTVAGRGYRFALAVTEAARVTGSEELASDQAKPDAAPPDPAASARGSGGWIGRRRMAAGAVLGLLLVAAAVAWHEFSISRPAATADGCPSGLVWRDAYRSDHLCVTPEVQAQVRAGQLGPALQPPAADVPPPSVGTRLDGMDFVGSDFSYFWTDS